jgi:hypothetical protein
LSALSVARLKHYIDRQSLVGHFWPVRWNLRSQHCRLILFVVCVVYWRVLFHHTDVPNCTFNLIVVTLTPGANDGMALRPEWRFDNGATFFPLGWNLLHHTQASPGVIMFQADVDAMVSIVKNFTLA